jgi:putative membrane protein
MNLRIQCYLFNQIIFMKRMISLFAVSTLFILSCNNEAKDPVEQADSANKQARIDTTTMAPAPDAATSSFLVDAANGGMAEVALSRLAAEKSSNAAVKNFARMMITDHTAANDQVKTLAAQKNVTLPADVSEENRKTADDLMKKTGKDFDKDYVDIMQKDHEKTVKMFENAASNIKDADVISFANNTLPKLRAHLDSIKVIRKNWK